MCIGVPGQVLSVSGATAIIECWGAEKSVRLGPDAGVIAAGDYVIEHEDTIVRRIPPEEVEDTFALYETILIETYVPA